MTFAIARAAVARTIPAARTSPTLWLAFAIAAIAIVAYRAWWSVVFVAFAGAIALMDRRSARPSQLIGMALALAGPPVLGLASLILATVSQYTPFPCGPFLCSTGPPVLVAGIAAGIGAGVALAGSVWYLRRHGSWPSLLPAFSTLLLGLFAAELIAGASGSNTVVEIGALAGVAGALPLALERAGLLRAALIAQLADLGTFGLVWQAGQGERNPVAGWIFEALFTRTDGYWSSWEAPVVTGLILIIAKLALIGFLLRATPYLGRYQRVVLLAAAAAGVVGAVANVRAFPLFA